MKKYLIPLTAFFLPLIAKAQDLGGTLLQQAGVKNAGYKDVQIETIIGGVINAFLGILGVIFLVLIVYAGYIWMIARGDESKTEKAKNTIVNSVIGIVIVVAAYAITSFMVTAFNPAASGNGAPATAPATDDSSGAPALGSPDATSPGTSGATDPTAACGGCPLCTWGCKGGTDLPCSCADTPGNST